jgi:hypothetical protein
MPVRAQSVLPTPSPIPAVPSARTAPHATPSPPPQGRIGISGVWEVQIQMGGTDTIYTHFSLRQQGDALTGVYLDQHGKRYPIAGSIDGDRVHLVVTLPDGKTILFEGTVSGTTDMLGMMTDAKQSVAFTAAYRPKENPLQYVAPGAGMGGLGGIPPR